MWKEYPNQFCQHSLWDESGYNVVQFQTPFWPHEAVEKVGPEEFACACVNLSKSKRSRLTSGKGNTLTTVQRAQKCKQPQEI
jgi:hypothetical protein